MFLWIKKKTNINGHKHDTGITSKELSYLLSLGG